MFNDRKDVERMAKIRDGDKAAFEELFLDYKDSIARFFYHLCFDHSRTQDLVQEVFLRIWRSAGGFRGTGKFSTYLYQIAKNLWINERAKDARRIRALPQDPDREDGTPDIPDSIGTPLEQALDRETAGAVRRAVGSLDEKKQVVFVLSEFQDFKYAQIADILGIPVGTVKSRMAAAERQLREKLKRYLHEQD
jgi:RNA polymerase sigma-70 factor (ECF subfamily)